MDNTKYLELKEHLKNVLKTAKKLGLVVHPGGGYSMGYDINNLPPYPVGLFGALSIVDGVGARCKLGLTFEQTESLEAGFNGLRPEMLNKKKKKRIVKIDNELVMLGTELRSGLNKSRNKWKTFDTPWAPMPTEPLGVFDTLSISAAPAISLPASMMNGTLEKKIAAKKKQINYTAIAAQIAPAPPIAQVAHNIALQSLPDFPAGQ